MFSQCTKKSADQFLFLNRLAKIAEVGLSHRQVIRLHYRKPTCRKDVLSASSVTIYEFAPHLMLLIFGMIFAVGFCAFERIVAERGGVSFTLRDNEGIKHSIMQKF